jgi:hypothetical protein
MTPLLLGLYVDDFIYFLVDPKVETLFCHLLAEQCKVDFMGIIEWLLGVHFCGTLLLLQSRSISINQIFATNLLRASPINAEHDTYDNAVPFWDSD